MLGPILLSIHNLTYYQRIMQGAREAIEQDRYRSLHRREEGRLGRIIVTGRGADRADSDGPAASVGGSKMRCMPRSPATLQP